MKKKILLAVLSVLALCSCDSSGTSSSSSTPSEFSNSVEEANDWTTEQKKLMQEHLYGIVLPYFGVGKNMVEYNGVYNEIRVQGDTTVNQAQLQAYKELYLADGWYDASSQYSDEPIENVYILQKTVDVKTEKRYVDVQFYVTATLDASEPEASDEGKFVLTAYDDHIYEFPTAKFDEGIKANAPTSNVHVPVFDADVYTLVSGYYEVYCYTKETNALATYRQALTDNNFTILDEKDSQGYYVAVSPDKQFAVYFGFAPKSWFLDFGMLDILLNAVPELPSETWPNDKLTATFEKYSNTTNFTDKVPPMTSETSTLTFMGSEDPNNYMHSFSEAYEKINFIIKVYGANETDVTNYENTTLKDAGWSIDEAASLESGEGTKVFKQEIENKIAKISVATDTKFVTIRVYLYLQEKPVEQWPSEKIKSTIDKSYILDELPALISNKVTEYQVHAAEFNWDTFRDEAWVDIFCGTNDIEEVYSAYVSVLKTSDWNEYKENDYPSRVEYISPNKELIVRLVKSTSSVQVYFFEAPLTSWPSTYVERLSNEHQYNDKLPDFPEMEGEKLSFSVKKAPYNRYQNSFKINIVIDKSNNKTSDTLLETYKKALEDASYTQSTRNDDILEHEIIYDSPNKEFDVLLNTLGTDELEIIVTPITAQ